jgi:serine/threonine protein kinase
MTPVQPSEESLFEAARQLAGPVARQAFLEQACAHDPERRRRVERLLAAEGAAAEFFQAASAFGLRDLAGVAATGPAPAGEDALEPAFTRGLGTHIGRYKLLQKIGEGGCGMVYMAEQEEPVRRRIALKVIKLGMDTKQVIARFEAERQALALMDHPNIARVLDAGATETGRPYFVMELVRGVKITEYCDQNQLATRDRLELFIQICHAIQHAHQKGIIHRDIKPSNILVTLHDGVPVPKVIDFGIAKATHAPLTDKTLFTAYEQLIGTPAYMSPEQAEMSGLDIDTRSDIYSLGVLLYELLTGKTPFDARELMQSGLDEMRRTLREAEPYRPSARLNTLQSGELTATAQHRHVEPLKLISQLRGDMDWIVMKALEKDRTRRYETANGLAMDVRRHLNNEPVVARPPTRWYRLQKLVRRNQGVFAAIGAVSVALLVGLGTSTGLYFRARAAEHTQIQLRRMAEQARDNEMKLRRQAEAREKITQAEILVNEEKFDEADQFLGEIPVAQPTLEGAAVYRSLGEWHALQNRWRPAADRFAVLLQVDQLDGWDVSSLDLLRQGATLAYLGDQARYDRFCHDALASSAGTANPVVAERTVKICLLLPAGQAMIESLGPLADTASRAFLSVTNEDPDPILQAAWGSVSIALMEYRRGNYTKTVEWSRRCLNYSEDNLPRTATAHLLLAMARQKLGQHDEALTELAAGRDVIENKFAAGLDRGDGEIGFWFDWVFGRILLREAGAVCAGPAAK